MDSIESVIPYREVLKFEHAQRGAYAQVEYTPTFRASAIFFVLVDSNINTHVSFMNYWREKNGNPSVSAMLTLRTKEGRKIYRDFFALEDFAYQFSLRDLATLQTPFVGSLEVELFSSQDLKYAFPAIEVFHETSTGISFVHSNQRVFNSIEDLDRNSAMNPWQTGFDLYVNDEYGSWLSIINGPRQVKDSKAILKIYNADGDVMDTTIPLGDLAPYAARFILLKEAPSVQPFLKGDVGFCKVNFDTFGVFTRIACGTLSHDASRFTVTHSYYDCSGHSDYYQKSGRKDDEYACFLPFNLLEGLDLDLIFYPIYARSTLLFSIDCFSPDGGVRARIDMVASLDSTGAKMLRLNVRELLSARGISPDNSLYCLHVDSPDGRIPARVPFGLNYRKGELGCNINSSMLMNDGHGVRQRLYLWGPLICREAGDSWILLSHLSKIKGAREEAEISLKVFTQSGPIFHERYRTRNGTALNLNARALISQSGYQPRVDEILWYTLESSCPNYVSNQIHVSQSGFVGGDHSF